MPASRTRRLAARDPAQVVAEAARGLGRTAVVDPDPERDPMAADPDPDRDRERAAVAPDPDPEQDRTAVDLDRDPDPKQGPMAVAPERGPMAAGREKARMAAAPERGPMVAGREPARKRAAAKAARQPHRKAVEVGLRRVNGAVVLRPHPGSTVALAQRLDRAADRGQHRGSTAVRAG